MAFDLSFSSQRQGSARGGLGAGAQARVGAPPQELCHKSGKAAVVGYANVAIVRPRGQLGFSRDQQVQFAAWMLSVVVGQRWVWGGKDLSGSKRSSDEEGSLIWARPGMGALARALGSWC